MSTRKRWSSDSTSAPDSFLRRDSNNNNNNNINNNNNNGYDNPNNNIHNIDCIKDNNNNSSGNNGNDIESRIKAARKAVKLGTHEALKLIEGRSTLPGLVLSSNSNSFPSTSINDTTSINDNENIDPNYHSTTTINNKEDVMSKDAFELGMSLFGEDSERITENEILYHLTKAEEELKRVTDSIITNVKVKLAETTAVDDMELISEIDNTSAQQQDKMLDNKINSENEVMEDDDNNHEKNKEETTTQQMQQIVSIQRLCHEARLKLNDIYNNNEPHGGQLPLRDDSLNLFSLGGDYNEVDAISPISKKGDNNSSGSTTATNSNTAAVSEESRVALLLNQAVQYIRSAETSFIEVECEYNEHQKTKVNQQSSANESTTTATTTTIIFTTEEEFYYEDQLHSTQLILDDVRTNYRSERCKFITNISSIIDNQMHFDNEGITVVGCDGSNGIGVVLKALLILSSSNSSGSSSYSPSKYPGDDPLEDAMGCIASNLSQMILTPIIARYDNKNRRNDNVDDNDNNNSMKGGPKFEMNEVRGRDKNSKGLNIGGTSSLSLNNSGFGGGSTTTTRREYIRLEWKEVQERSPSSLESEINEGGEEEVVISEAKDLLQSVQSFTNLLKFVQSILSFLRERVFNCDARLCAVLGKKILGDGTDNDTSNPLDGILNNTNTFGFGCGGVGSDNTRISEKITKILLNRCIPESYQTDVLNVLPKVAYELRECTTAFEKDLIKMGYLVRKRKKKIEQQNLDSAANSTDAVIITDHYLTKNAPQPPILSITKRAADFERTYVEKRRSKILSKGRQLLMSKDCHDTIRVGDEKSFHPTTISSSSSSNKVILPPSFAVDGIDGCGPPPSVFALSSCAITQVTFDLFEIVRETMDAAVAPVNVMNDEKSIGGGTDGSDDINYVDKDTTDHHHHQCSLLLPPTLYRTTRELLDLFRAIVPASRGSEARNIPRSAALLHNDCVFLAHRLLLFGLEYRDRFNNAATKTASAAMEEEVIRSENNVIRKQQRRNKPEPTPLSMLCTFVDMVPTFRDIADRTMGDMIQSQRSQLAEIAASRTVHLSESLHSDENMVEWADSETGLSAGLYHLRYLSRSWEHVLSRDCYGRSMGSLSDSLLLSFLDPVMNATDISEPACQFVVALFCNASKGVAGLFDQSWENRGGGVVENEVEEEGSAAMMRGCEKEAARFCGVWDKFDAVRRFMDMSSEDVKAALLSGGTFRSLTATELSGLVVAVFQDSERRADILHLLSSE